jgi:xanthine/CO dehydrogenase XdhC/CoxF family maturation factor
MTTNNALLVDFFEQRRKRREPLVLATVVHTEGSTYRKPGAQMLIARDGQVAGLLSGGCAESDLLERASRVFETGIAQIAEYDTRGTDDAIWGIGLGCEGAMRILLSRLGSDNEYQPFAFIRDCLYEHRDGSFALVVASDDAKLPLGQAFHSGIRDLPTELLSALRSREAQTHAITDAKIFVAPISLPPRLLVLGAGADAQPVVEMAGLLGWQITIADHRPAYALADRFPRARRVVLANAVELPKQVALNDFDAAVVMSHHLPTDRAYLAALAHTSLGHIGLLGPPARRMRLLNELGDDANRLASRLASPVGLDIGAQMAEAIAMAMVAEIHAYLHGRTGVSFSGLLKALPNNKQ